MANILVVEDDVLISQGIADYLESLGHQLDFAYNGEQALVHLKENIYELVLLDLNLPMIDGLEVCKTLSQGSLTSIPVIIMSARGENADILAGFDSGAWDYLVKPFSFSELAARINVSLTKLNAISHPLQEYHGLVLEKNSLTLEYHSKKIQLHKIGFTIIESLMQCAPKSLKKNILEQKVWGENKPSSDPLRAHIYKLRKIFMQNFSLPLIVTVKGVGYRLDV